MFVFQRALLYRPDTSRPDPAVSGVPEMAWVDLATEDGLTLGAWYRAAHDGAPSLVYFHGNGGHLGDRAFKYRAYLDAGFGLLAVGYRGYCGNPGTPMETGLMRDGQAALEFLQAQGVPPGKTVLYGESLGAGLAIRLAAWRDLAGLVLETPYTSIGKVAASHYPFVPARYLVLDQFDAEAVISQLKAPLLVLHGAQDRVIPERFGRALFEQAPQPTEMEIYPQGGHNNLYDFGAAFRVISFLRRLNQTSEPLIPLKP